MEEENDVVTIEDSPFEEPVTETVIHEEEVKTLSLTATVFHLDDVNLRERRVNYKGCKLEFHNPVSVTTWDGTVIGSALLTVQGTEVVADICLDYATPERLDLESEDGRRIYPHLSGYSMLKAEQLGYDTGIAYAKKVESLILSTYTTNDKRIDCLNKK